MWECVFLRKRESKIPCYCRNLALAPHRESIIIFQERRERERDEEIEGKNGRNLMWRPMFAAEDNQKFEKKQNGLNPVSKRLKCGF